MALSIASWNVRHVGKSGHAAVMSFDARFNKSGFSNSVAFEKITDTPSWEVIVDFAVPPIDPASPDYPHSAGIHDGNNFFEVAFTAKWSGRAGIQYGTTGSFGPIPDGRGRRDVTIELFNSQRQLIYRQQGYYHIT